MERTERTEHATAQDTPGCGRCEKHPEGLWGKGGEEGEESGLGQVRRNYRRNLDLMQKIK